MPWSVLAVGFLLQQAGGHTVDAGSCPRPRAQPCVSGMERVGRPSGDLLCEQVVAPSAGPVRWVFVERRKAGAFVVVVRQTARAALSQDVPDAADRFEAPLDAGLAALVGRVCGGVVTRARPFVQDPRPPTPRQPGSRVVGGMLDGRTMCIAAGTRAADVGAADADTLLGRFSSFMLTLADLAERQRGTTAVAVRTAGQELEARLGRNESCVRPD